MWIWIYMPQVFFSAVHLGVIIWIVNISETFGVQCSLHQKCTCSDCAQRGDMPVIFCSSGNFFVIRSKNFCPASCMYNVHSTCTSYSGISCLFGNRVYSFIQVFDCHKNVPKVALLLYLVQLTDWLQVKCLADRTSRMLSNLQSEKNC